MKTKKSTDIPKLLINIAIPLVGGSAVGLLTKNAMKSFEALAKPPLSPPGIVFPIAWSALYILMGVSSYLVYKTFAKDKSKAWTLYGANLFLNFSWTVIFFVLEKYLFAFIWLVCLFVIVAAMCAEFAKINKTAAYLQLPYLLWLVFAGYLNMGVFLLNG